MSYNTDRQLNEIRNTIHKQNEEFNRELEIIKKKQSRNSVWLSIVFRENVITEMKNAVDLI